MERVRCPVCGKLSPESYFDGAAKDLDVKLCEFRGKGDIRWRDVTLTRVLANKVRDTVRAAARLLDEMLD